jgi:hypothetical protein
MEGLASQTGNLDPLGMFFFVVLGILTWCLPRRAAAIPLLLATCYMPLTQKFVIAGLHFPFMRFLLLIAWFRIWARKEVAGLRLTPLDKLFIWWLVATVVVGTLTKPSIERFVNRSGELYDAAGTYFLVRCWVRNIEEAIVSIRAIAAMVVPLALAMLIERTTARNVFSVFGGVPESTEIRDGVLRCRGSFLHAILAGTYGATVFPLAAGLWFLEGRWNKRLAIVGACGAVVVTMMARSSGAFMALLSAVCGFVLWRLRYQMRLVRYGALALVIALSLLMNSPVWHLMARLGDATGGTGWHRSFLIDQAVAHFGEWWLVGSAYTAHWSYTVLAADPDNMDITNEYIMQGLTGGVWKLGLLLAMIIVGFKMVGGWTNRPAAGPCPRQLFVWSLGICLFGHCVSFLSVAYFDQIVVMWYWVLAVISMLGDQLHDQDYQTESVADVENGFENRLEEAERA